MTDRQNYNALMAQPDQSALVEYMLSRGTDKRISGNLRLLQALVQTPIGLGIAGLSRGLDRGFGLTAALTGLGIGAAGMHDHRQAGEFATAADMWRNTGMPAQPSQQYEPNLDIPYTPFR